MVVLILWGNFNRWQFGLNFLEFFIRGISFWFHTQPFPWCRRWVWSWIPSVCIPLLMPVTWSRKDVNESSISMSERSNGLNLFSRPFLGVLITITVKPNWSLMVGPRFRRGIANQRELTSGKMHERCHRGEHVHNNIMVSQWSTSGRYYYYYYYYYV